MSDEPAGFYIPLGADEFESTTATTSPWDPASQHGGPPSALLARAITVSEPTTARVIARFTVDFFGAVPQGRVRTAVRVLRPGRRVELVEATLSADAQVVAVARAWRIAPSPDAIPISAARPPVGPERPAAQPQRYFEGVGPEWGYGKAIEWRFVQGGYGALGRAVVWTRAKIPLVAGETSDGLQRMLIVADSINGLSAELDLREWLFVPPGLTLTAHRLDAADWILLDASTVLDRSGVALAHGTVSDERGELALVSQPLLVQRR